VQRISTVKDQTDVIELPAPIARYFAADTAGDAAALAGCFVEDGIVTDEGVSFTGVAEIRLWHEDAKDKYRYTVEPVSMTEQRGRIVVVGRVTGDFPGSPVHLEHVFSVTDDKIAQLEIR
jgi:SnoaL-like domain